MFKVRVIPCLDVKGGRVVKGTQFVDLRDAGDPVEAGDDANLQHRGLTLSRRRPRRRQRCERRG